MIVVSSSERKIRDGMLLLLLLQPLTPKKYIEKVYFCFLEFMYSLYFIIAAPAPALLSSTATTTHNPKVIYGSNINTFAIIVVRIEATHFT